MLAMQYSIPLPENVDAAFIRERVSNRRVLFDEYGGLLHKSFIYNERDHLYAPFYVWKDMAPARNFLLDDLFKGVIETFNRHRVRSWIVMEMGYGNRDIVPSYAMREVDPVASEETLKEFRTRENEMHMEMLAHPDLYMHLVALDADRWELMRYSLWRDASTAPESKSDCLQTYEVLHVSEPTNLP